MKSTSSQVFSSDEPKLILSELSAAITGVTELAPNLDQA